jgi:hypothetical protein
VTITVSGEGVAASRPKNCHGEGGLFSGPIADTRAKLCSPFTHQNYFIKVPMREFNKPSTLSTLLCFAAFSATLLSQAFSFPFAVSGIKTLHSRLSRWPGLIAVQILGMMCYSNSSNW